jgi:hypothetical protein
MRRDLERRLTAVEARFGGRVGTILRICDAFLASLSDEEMTAEFLACQRGEGKKLFDPRTLTNTELAQLTAGFQKRAEGIRLQRQGKMKFPT